MADELGLKLTAQITEWVGNLDKAAKAADRLLQVVREVEKGIKAAFAGIEAAADQGAGKGVAAFVAASRKIDQAAASIEKDANRTSKALQTVGTTATRTAKTVDAAAREMGSSTGAATRQTVGNLSAFEASFKSAGDRVSGAVLNIRNAVLGLGALRFGQAAVESASEFEAALGQLAIVSKDTGVPIQDLRKQLLDLSKETPLALGDLTKAYATAVGSLPKGANQAQVAFEALNAAQQAARASGATTEETLRGITALLNTYGDTGITAAEITDKLFATFDQGAATVPELTASIGQVAGIAKGFGISIDEVFGSIAVLTRGGQTASEAITNLRQALISTANGGSMDKVAGELQKLGLSAELFSAQSLRQNGLIGVLEQVEKAGGKPILNKLFTDTQGLLAVQTLLAKGLAQTRDDIARVGDSAGKTDEAVATIAQNFDQLAGIAKNRLGAALIDIGERIIPTVGRVLNQLADFAEKNGEAIASGIGRAVEVLASMGEWVVKYGPTVLQWFLVFKGASFFIGLAKDIKGATVALIEFQAGLKASQALGEGFASLGSTAGEKFNTGLAGKLKNTAGLFKGALSSIPLLGAGVAAFGIGYEIGTKIAEAIGDAIERDGQIAIQDAISALEGRTRAALAGFGARTQEELEAARARRRSGEVVDTEGAGRIGDLRTLADIKTGGGDVSAAFNRELEARTRDEVRALGRMATQRADAMAAESGVEDLKRRRAAPPEIAAAEANLDAVRRGVTEAESAVADLQAGTVALVRQYGEVTKGAVAAGKAGADGTKAAAKGAKAAADTFLADLVRDYEAAQEKLRSLALEAAGQAADALSIEVDTRRTILDRDTEARIAALRGVEDAEVKIAAVRLDRARQEQELAEQEIVATREASEARILGLQEAADRELADAGASAEIKKAIQKNLNTAIRNEEAAQIQRMIAIRGEAKQEVVDATADEKDARAARFAKENVSSTSAVSEQLSGPGAALVRGAESIGAAGAEVGGILGTAAEGLALAATGIGAAALLVMNLPDILNGIAGILTDGIDTFVGELFDAILNVAFALVEGLPSQIERLLSVTIPAFITALIAALPRLIGALIAAIPRIAFALVKAITYDLLIGLEEGFKQAGATLVNFFAEGLPRVFNRILEEIKDFFGPDGESAFFGGRGNARTSVGRAFEKRQASQASGGVSDLVGFVRGLLHQGGTVDTPSNPHVAAVMAAAGAPRFAGGGMVTGVDSLARRRLSQILSGDDVPSLLAPGEGVLTARGVEAAGGPNGIESLNRGNPGGGTQGAQVVLSARIGGDAALAAMISRIVSVSIKSPGGNVRMAMNQSQLATTIPGYAPVRQ